MAAGEQRIRLHFLLVLTLVVIALGVTNVARNLRQERARVTYERTEEALSRYLTEALREEQERLEDFARAERGRISRDAAALVAQARHLLEVSRLRPPSVEDSRVFDRILDNFERLKAGEPAAFPGGESYLRAFYCPIDGAFKPYSLCVPTAYPPDSPMPLIVHLPGQKTAYPGHAVGTDCYAGALSAKTEVAHAAGCPMAGVRQTVGMLEEVKALYPVDPNRVYLLAEDGGTTSAWHLAVRHPHLFAGLVALGDDSVYLPAEKKAGTDPAPTISRDEVTEFLRASVLPLSYAENLHSTRTVVAQSVPTDSRAHRHGVAMARRLQELGYETEFLQFPDVPPGRLPDWVKGYGLGKVFGAPPVHRPRRLRFKTADLRHNESWWLRVERLDDPLAFAIIEGEVNGEELRLSTENVSAFSLLGGRLPRGVTEVYVDGRSVSVDSLEGTLTFVREEAAWRLSDLPPGKTRGLSGPVADVLREPFLLVYGTAGEDELHRKVSRREAERFARYRAAITGDGPRMKADTEVTDNDIETLNLVLFGGPEVNAVTARVLEGLPVRFAEEGVRLGERLYEGPDTGVVLCHPNPLAKQRMVALVAGSGPESLFQASDRFGLWFGWPGYERHKWFDYAIFDGRSVGPGSFREVGFFTNAWQPAEPGAQRGDGGAALNADPALVERLRPQAFPRLASAAEADAAEVALSEVMPTKVDQPGGAVGFNRSFAGRPIQLGGSAFEMGLGVQAPSELTYELPGHFGTFTATVGPTPGFGLAAPPLRPRTVSYVFEVLGDGALLASAHGALDGPDQWESHSITADVTGVRKLTLRVRLPEADAVPAAFAWGDPTLTR